MNFSLAIHGKEFSADMRPLMKELWADITSKNCKIQISENFKSHLKDHDFDINELESYSDIAGPENVQMAWSIGGDGTFLETLTHIGAKEIPILGINTGRLGFLATLSPEEVPQALHHVLSNQYSIENRCLVSVDSEIDLFSGKDFGLNEVAIMKTDSSSMIQIKTFLDGNFLNTYWADGLIVSTATGSTGYSLSIGGPLVIPTSNAFIIAPMSPHNLNVRPLIVSSESILKFEVSSRSQNFLISIDSRSRVIDSKISIEVKKALFSGKIVKIPGDNFLQTLRNKLNWGLDVRN